MRTAGVTAMKVRNSLKSLRSRHRNNQLVRRKGRVYVINKVQRRFQGSAKADTQGLRPGCVRSVALRPRRRDFTAL